MKYKNISDKLESKWVRVSEIPLEKLVDRVSKFVIDKEREDIIKKIYTIFLITWKTSWTTSMLNNLKNIKTLLPLDWSFIRSVFKEDFFSSITWMQGWKWMISKTDFDNLIEYCTIDWVLNMQLLRYVAWIQTSKWMISKEDFDKIMLDKTI